VSRAKNAKDAKIVFNKKRVMGGAFASLACLAGDKSESGKRFFRAKSAKDAKEESWKNEFALRA
jgi:hypothetical protein